MKSQRDIIGNVHKRIDILDAFNSIRWKSKQSRANPTRDFVPIPVSEAIEIVWILSLLEKQNIQNSKTDFNFDGLKLLDYFGSEA